MMNSFLMHFFTHAEHYTIALVWIVLPLAGLFAYFRLSRTAAVSGAADEDFDGLS